jgi:hypothetical protein
MLRHIALFKWKDETTPAQVAAVVQRLGKLPSEVPEIAGYSFGSDAGLSEGAADFAVVADFATEADWRTYMQHPAHLKVIEDVIVPIRESRVFLQYEAEAEG